MTRLDLHVSFAPRRQNDFEWVRWSRGLSPWVQVHAASITVPCGRLSSQPVGLASTLFICTVRACRAKAFDTSSKCRWTIWEILNRDLMILLRFYSITNLIFLTFSFTPMDPPRLQTGEAAPETRVWLQRSQGGQRASPLWLASRIEREQWKQTRERWKKAQVIGMSCYHSVCRTWRAWAQDRIGPSLKTWLHHPSPVWWASGLTSLGLGCFVYKVGASFCLGVVTGSNEIMRIKWVARCLTDARSMTDNNNNNNNNHT